MLPTITNVFPYLHYNVHPSLFTYVDQLDAILLNGVQGYCDVLQGVWLRLRPLVVSQLPFLQRLNQGYQPATKMSALRYVTQVQRSGFCRTP